MLLTCWRIYCLSVCPSVICMVLTSRKNYWSDLNENFIRDVSVDNFGSHLHLGPDLENFWRIFQHCKIGHFFTYFAQVCGKLIGSSEKNYHKLIFSPPLNFWKSSRSEAWIRQGVRKFIARTTGRPRQQSEPVASLGGGGAPPQVTPSRGWQPTKIHLFVAEFRKNTG